MHPSPETPHPLIPPGTRALILDYDGTLADTTGSNERALREALVPYGIALDPAWYQQHVGRSIHDLLAQLPGAAALPNHQIIAASRRRLLASLHILRAIPATLSLLHAARNAGLPCAIASGASSALVHPALDALHLRNLFDTVVVREDALHGKPAPDLYLEAARRLGIPPLQCLAVDDADDGITAGHRAGMTVLTLTGGELVPAHAGEAR